jgi:hypothetical protein
MTKCEHCGYPGAAAKWCARCSSIDPFPSRRRLALALLLALLAAIGVFVVGSVRRHISEEQTPKNEAAKQSFVSPRIVPAAGQ